ncbi:acyltransferase family protein [Microbacterium sp. 4R-513]|uniref:SGNH hydrolase domain-containing protein n=1 Tax=Microbacterium sp. 4R-513 TaxID=2567934 RepID=UPI0013E1EDA2|nr:SGNH hydrolase domain-containing protein [Microbacterium sp. 4R-513]QIG39889.1 acyltransferase family protein [Microbacterium sp. 4R-513]
MAERTPTGADSSGFRPDIQGLRAIAVGAVVLYHAGLPFLPGGYVGVDIFFVISGFLITTHLLGSLTREGRIRFGSFYARRARRILPASFLVLLLSVVAALIWYPPLLIEKVWRGAVATALYVPNYLFAMDQTDYLAQSTNPSLFQHYWSLGVEEQFYLVWPALLGLAWAVVRSKRALFWVLVAVVAASFVSCVWFTFQSQPIAFFWLPTRAWELGVGGLVAFLLLRRERVASPAVAPVLGWLGIAAIGASVALFSSKTLFPGAWAALPVLGTALVIAAGATPHRLGPGRMLSVRGMVLVGTISYSLYLVHWPALVIPESVVRGGLPLWATLLIALACVPVAWAMFRFVEDPMRRAPWLTRARTRRTLIGAAIGSVACLLVATGAYAVADTRSLNVAEEASAPAIQDPPQGTDFVPENLRPSLREADESLPQVYADDCVRGIAATDAGDCLYGDPAAPRIVLFGDSHAAHWFPALDAFALSAGYAVEVHTKSSCPYATIESTRRGTPYPQCAEWRKAVIEAVNASDPVIVLLAGYSDPDLAPGVKDDVATWEAAYGATLDAITVPKAVIADTPDIREDPAPCLSAHLSDAEVCGQPRSVALQDASREAAAKAAAARGVPLLDFNDYLCTADWCPPIIGDALVYRDSHHMTAAFSALLGGVMGEKLRPLLNAAPPPE